MVQGDGLNEEKEFHLLQDMTISGTLTFNH